MKTIKKKYTIPSISPKDLDMKKKPWFVWFRFYNENTKERELQRIKADLNSISDKRERILAANSLVQVLTQKLEAGWNPLTESIEDTGNELSLKQQFDEILKAKVTSLTDKSLSDYNYILGIFNTWLTSKQFHNIYPQNFTNTMARQYLNFLVIDKAYAGKTHNTHLAIIKSWFTDLVNIKIVNDNPFAGIEELPEETGKNFAYNTDEQKKLKPLIFKEHRRLYYACNFLFYLLIRPKELKRMRVEDINFESKTVIVHSGKSKNRKQQSVTIPTGLEKIMLDMGLDLAPKHFFVFGKNNETVETPSMTANGLAGAHRRYTRRLKLPEEKSFYSWKHTGACALYKATKDPYVVMDQCRHSDIKITMVYLRSLGLTVNETVRQADYVF